MLTWLINHWMKQSLFYSSKQILVIDKVTISLKSTVVLQNRIYNLCTV